MSKTVLSFGELLWDLLPSGPELGGAPSNFAFRMNAFGHRTALVTRIGKDELGEKALEALGAKGVETRFVQIDTKFPTGTVHVDVDDRGETDFEIVPDVAYDQIEITAQLCDLALQADCVCFGTLVQRTAKSRKTLYEILNAAKSALKVLDINLRKDCYSEQSVRESLSRADILKLNDAEVVELGRLLGLPPDIAEFAQAIGNEYPVRCCVVTRGRNGVHACAREGSRWIECQLPGHKVAVQDTCGSGDAFTAGFAHKFLEKATLAECCACGNALGAIVATTKGAMTPVALTRLDTVASGT